MRTPLNKALTQTREATAPTVGILPRKADKVNETFKKVADAAAAVKGESPALKAQYLKGIEAAQEAQKAADLAKEAAETLTDFNKACDDESRARDNETFFRKQLKRLIYTPRMDEAEYYGHVESVEATVEKAAADFRKTAEKAMSEIIEAKEKYLSTAAEADDVLEDLDAAANVLQCVHRYRVKNYLNAPSQKIEDRAEWKRHAIRYISTGKAFDLVSQDDAGRNNITCAAWTAADRARER